MQPFMTQRDAEMRLHDTIGLYHGQPVYITVSPEDPLNVLTVRGFFDRNSQRVKIPCNHPALDVHSIEVGYCNDMDMTGRCKFITRIPARIQKQGLCGGNTQMGGRACSTRNLVARGVHDMLINKYPSYDEVLNSVLDDTYVKYAFHKEYCIEKMDEYLIALKHNERVIATYENGKWQVMAALEQSRSFYITQLSEEGLTLI